jgi:hypothetical protein
VEFGRWSHARSDDRPENDSECHPECEEDYTLVLPAYLRDVWGMIGTTVYVLAGTAIFTAIVHASQYRARVRADEAIKTRADAEMRTAGRDLAGADTARAGPRRCSAHRGTHHAESGHLGGFLRSFRAER